MSQENAGNSWYKFLESLQETSTKTSLNRRKIVFAKLNDNSSYPEIKLCLLSYECIMCSNHILEIREDDTCEHQCCEACAPRIHCSEDCIPWFIYDLPANDLESQQEIIDQFKPETGVKLVKVGSKKKRKRPEDHEMQE
ncbi:uncharacterized protein LOC132945817 [Metopolophium dirhodum]|uniref:uncharacterized protein LOC132945817 n=1 Tax=Metopolophium dirhodum TaxID=44670 RepID=UPI0029905436|nr:uncharacterized protein LOC132945817 [Metopolophium dirhodum]